MTRLGQRLTTRFPTLFAAIALSNQANVVDRAAAVALFCVFAAVPSLFVALSVIGFLLDEVALAGHVASTVTLGAPTVGMQDQAMAQIDTWVHNALPGVTWNPAEFAQTLVEHKTAHGVFGSFLAVSLSLAVLSRIDGGVRAIFGLPSRSTLRAMGVLTLFVVLGAFAAILVTLLGPALEWGARVAGRSVTALSLGQLDGWSLLVTAAETLPVAVGFYGLVRWSTGRLVSKRKLTLVALSFGLLWFGGQRLFSVYVQNVVHMDAVYGALTGIVALMMWMFYANMAFLYAVCFLAAWHNRPRARTKSAVHLPPSEGSV